MTEPNHLPWFYDDITRSCTITDVHNRYIGHIDKVENAQSMIRAVNSHDDLVAACEAALNDVWWREDINQSDVDQQIRDAIAKTRDNPQPNPLRVSEVTLSEVIRLNDINRKLLVACQAALDHLYQEHFFQAEEALKEALCKARGGK